MMSCPRRTSRGNAAPSCAAGRRGLPAWVGSPPRANVGRKISNLRASSRFRERPLDSASWEHLARAREDMARATAQVAGRLTDPHADGKARWNHESQAHTSAPTHGQSSGVPSSAQQQTRPQAAMSYSMVVPRRLCTTVRAKAHCGHSERTCRATSDVRSYAPSSLAGFGENMTEKICNGSSGTRKRVGEKTEFRGLPSTRAAQDFPCRRHGLIRGAAHSPSIAPSRTILISQRGN